MKKIITLILCLVSLISYSQRVDEYTADNGITYKEGDTIKLGRGSGLQGTFVHLQMGGWMAGSQTQIGANYANLAVEIKKIFTRKLKGTEKTYFVVGGGNITNYNLMIDEAIQTCEVVPCDSKETASGNEVSKYELLAQIKTLYDDGVLTAEEFEIEKAKILK